MAGGISPFEDKSIYVAHEIVGEQWVKGSHEYRMSWEGYDQTYNTWEPAKNILDPQLIVDFEAGRQVVVDTGEALWACREGMAQVMFKIRHTRHGYVLSVPQASYSSVGQALLLRIARPPPREGKEPLEMEIDVSGGFRTTAIQYNLLSDIGWFLSLELVREERRKALTAAWWSSVAGAPATTCGSLGLPLYSRTLYRDTHTSLLSSSTITQYLPLQAH